MSQSARELLASLEFHQPPAEADDLVRLSEAFGRTPPQDYLDAISYCNGAEGPIGEAGYIMLWSVDRAVSWSASLREFQPGLFAFASDGGDTAYGFDLKDDRLPVVQFSLSSIDLPERSTPSVTELLNFLAHS